MPTIYISPTKKNTYLKVTLTPKARRNIGIIERGGHLNAKPELREMIRQAGGDFRRAPGFTVARHGSTHSVAGSGYDSYAGFPSVADAKTYLGGFFTIV
jgi:hypothetical protein